MNNEEEDDLPLGEEEFIDYSELSRYEVLDFNKNKTDRWEKTKDFFDEIPEE